MGLDNPPGGPGKSPETTDKPAPQGTGGESPSAVPGADGRTPRIDSYKAAGQPVPGQPETGTQQPGDRDTQTNGSSSTGPASEKPRTPGDPPSEAEPKTEKEPETGKTEVGSRSGEEHDHDDTDPTQTGNSGPEAEKPDQAKTQNPQQDKGDRDGDDRESKTDQPKPGKVEGQDGGNGNDSTADDPASSEQPSNRPAEASQFPPGSRRASIAAAREQQMATADQRQAISQDTQTTIGTGERTAGETGDSSAPPQNKNAVSDEHGPETQPPNTETLPGATGDDDPSSGGDMASKGEGSGGHDQPAPATSGVEAEPPAQETSRPQDQKHEPRLPQDSSGSGDNSGDPPAEPPADGSLPADDKTRDGKDGTLPGAEVGQPTEPAAETGPAVPEPGREASPIGPETTDQGTEHPEPKADDKTTGNETDDPKPADETKPPPEGTGENVTPPEALGEQSDNHGKNAEGNGTESDPEATDESKPEVRSNPIISDVYTDSQGQVHVEPRYGREHTEETENDPLQNEPETIEPAGLPTRGDLDPVGARGGEPGRDELRRLEDDRASRDYQEENPDNRSRKRDLTRTMFTKADDVKDAADKLAEPGQKHLERVKPTGQICAARTNPDHIKSVDAKVQGGDITLGIVGTAVFVIEAGRQSIRVARRITGRDHARNQ
ncbi:hypothetical protein [Actinomadura mexicana]|uniref:hypothetical protein n=1 Tax=Actinomadura mexicana TaxID=134959 RepID=UPI0011776F62|nr:hypothetical protein [Actinomadura mexicana]